MNKNLYKVGMIVTHPNKPDWGPGKVQAINGNQITVYFRDLPEEKPGDAQKTLNLDYVTLTIPPVQSDAWLDNLPPYKEGRIPPKRIRLTLQQGIDAFLDRFPAGFNDKKYLSDPEGERGYKWEAHQRFIELLGDGQFEQLLFSNQLKELSRRIKDVQKGINILSIFEIAAFHDALKNEKAVKPYLDNLLYLLKNGPKEEMCIPYFEAVNNLPAEEGKSRVATWPVATVMPFLAKPDVFMFLKPDVTKQCADRLNFNLCYDAKPNWLTYSKLIIMCDLLMEHLRPLGARDMIDLQSFIWRISRD